MATLGEISPPEVIENDITPGARAGEGGIKTGEISSPEISEEDVIEGATAIHPGITVEELIHLVRDPETLEKIKKAKQFRFIVIGQTGIGKSTLINGLMGAEVAMVEEGLMTTGVTQKVESYSRKINNIHIAAYDSPGLEDGSGKEEQYLEQIYEACLQGMDLVIFSISMAGRRFVPDNPDARAMEKFTEKMTAKIWENTLVVLTCANTCEPVNPRLRKSTEGKKKFFKKLVSDYKAAIHLTLKMTGVPPATVEKVKVVPVGIEYEPKLPDGTLWFSNFWLECLTAITSTEAHIAMTVANRNRIKKEKDVLEKDFQQPIYDQPIIVRVTEEKKTLQLLASLGGVLGPAAVGLGLGALGVLAGPVGVVTIPVGLFLGMVLGAMATASYHHNM